MKSYCFPEHGVILLLILCGAFIVGSYHYYRFYDSVGFAQNSKYVRKENKNFLDGCYHVYLDVGFNIGIQIRKLFEPEKYPGAYLHSIFN